MPMLQPVQGPLPKTTATSIAEPTARPTARPTVPVSTDVVIISHSNVFYWWPAWTAGFAVALASLIQGQDVVISPGVVERVHPSNNPGIFFISVLVALVIFTNTRLRGIYSVVTIVAAAFAVVLFAWLGWWDNILGFIPRLSARANMGFYLVFSTALLCVWLLAFFVFDRLTVWRVRPGQMLVEHFIGGETRSYDTNGLVFEKRSQDLFHDVLLGFGAGDLILTTGGTNKETIRIHNVLMANLKMKKIERLITVKPQDVRLT
jgi:hypothetical protein